MAPVINLAVGSIFWDHASDGIDNNSAQINMAANTITGQHLHVAAEVTYTASVSAPSFRLCPERGQQRTLMHHQSRARRNVMWPLGLQVAKQEGEFVAQLMHKHKVRPGEALPQDAKAFKYSHKGSLAYVGKDRAVMDVPGVSPLTGYGAGMPLQAQQDLSDWWKTWPGVCRDFGTMSQRPVS